MLFLDHHLVFFLGRAVGRAGLGNSAFEQKDSVWNSWLFTTYLIAFQFSNWYPIHLDFSKREKSEKKYQFFCKKKLSLVVFSPFPLPRFGSCTIRQRCEKQVNSTGATMSILNQGEPRLHQPLLHYFKSTQIEHLNCTFVAETYEPPISKVQKRCYLSLFCELF